eukprot:m.357134 g.357134  ORF g.357134 m.357134 type:complete len:217 (-) comp55966_c0_seq4:195-845(-)
MAVNPWSSGSSWSPALALAAAHGIITDQERQACFVLPDEHDSSSPLEDGGSVLLTRRLRETSALAETLDATLSELQRSYLLCNTHLFTEPHQISRKIDMLREYSAHLSAVQSNKQLLTARIQRNMQKGALNIEAKNHKCVQLASVSIVLGLLLRCFQRLHAPSQTSTTRLSCSSGQSPQPSRTMQSYRHCGRRAAGWHSCSGSTMRSSKSAMQLPS